MKAPDVKKEELQFTGLEDFLRDKPNVTKQEVQDYLANNRVDVQEVTLGGNTAPSQDLLSWMSSRSIMTPRNPEGWQELSQKLERYAQQHQKAQGAPETSQRYFTLSEEAGRISEGLDAGGSAAGATKYDKYTLAGGDNYREILLTLPNQWERPRAAQIANEARIKELRQEMYGTSGTDEIRQEISRLHNENTALQKQISDAPIYKSSHFDQPNILAHMRVNDRIDADGKKMLLVEEIQSDWHQAGREKGYKTKESLEKWYNQNKLADDPDFASLNSEQRSVIERNRSAGMGGDNAVPDAPFKDTWYQLALKRLTKYAADNGYERIGLTTGRQQADRFNLAESFDAMNYKKNKDGTYALAVKPKGEGIFQSDFGGTTLSNIPEKDLPSIVGKELAQKIISGEGRQAASRKVLEGIDLQVGGEGMKKYYDEIYPKFLDKYGKKYGASVGETQITTGRSNVGGMPSMYPDKETIRYLDITPQMKEGTSKGQPLFAATPAIPAAGLLDEEKRKEITSLLD